MGYRSQLGHRACQLHAQTSELVNSTESAKVLNSCWRWRSPRRKDSQHAVILEGVDCLHGWPAGLSGDGGTL
jgi:hypothetical protein